MYCQKVLLGRLGGTSVSRAMEVGSMVRAGLAVQRLTNQLRDELMVAALVTVDETELGVLKEPERAEQTKS